MREKTIQPCGRDYSHEPHFTGESLADNLYCEGVDKSVEVPEKLIEDIHYRLHLYNRANDKANAAHHLIELFNLVHDLSSHHPGYDNNRGTLPWEVEEL